MAIAQMLLDIGWTEEQVLNKLNNLESKKLKQIKYYAASQAQNQNLKNSKDIGFEIVDSGSLNNAGGSESISKKYHVSEKWVEDVDGAIVETVNTLVSESKI